MTEEEIFESQKVEREKALQSILDSTDKKKIIVAGPGTGKTFTFSKILEQKPDGRNIAMTFIRSLRNDMEISLGDLAEVRTFHEYCKKILHENTGSVFLYPKLTKIIEEDASHLEIDIENFDEKFQNLDESGEEISFYLDRGDYYNTVSFNDSVYRMLKKLQNDSTIISDFDQILIDEYQDFNPLEVAFIDELENKGNILIVGDDDQAIYYNLKGSSPEHLRTKYNSEEYKVFELPFCNRCTEAIVSATNSIINTAKENGNLENRINKRFDCFIESKDADNKKYPKITFSDISNFPTLFNFIKMEIDKISEEEIKDSWKEGKEFPTVLIVGAKQYLNYLFKKLKEEYPEVRYKQPDKTEVSITDAYNYLLSDINSNLGWRILLDFNFTDYEIQTFIEFSKDDIPIRELLDNEFISKHDKIVELIKQLKKGDPIDSIKDELNGLISEDEVDEILENFAKNEDEEKSPDRTSPSILLTSFHGCKGLSANFVFIVGANNSTIPKNPDSISDDEISQFIVALTRTRKKCYILSEKYMYGAKDKKGNWLEKNEKSIFVDWISENNIENLGYLKTEDIKK